MPEAPIPVGDNDLVNTTIPGRQLFPQTLALQGGGWITWWVDQDSGNRTFARVFDAGGNPLGDDFQISSAAANLSLDGNPASITQREDGTLLAVWNDGLSGTELVIGRTLDADGTNLGPAFLLFQFVPAFVNLPGLSMLGDPLYVVATQDNGFALVFTAQEYTEGRIETHIQRYDADGLLIGGPVQLSDVGIANQFTPSESFYAIAQGVTQIEGGGHVVVWRIDRQTPTGTNSVGIEYAMIDPDGTFNAPAFEIPLPPESWQPNSVSATALLGGGFVISWEAIDGFMAQRSAFAQIFDADGVAVDEVFRLNGVPGGVSVAPSIAGLPDGGFIATFISNVPVEGTTVVVVGQRYDAAGDAIGEMFVIPVPPAVPGNLSLGYYTTEVAAQADGSFVVTWKAYDFENLVDKSDVYQRIFAPQTFGTFADEVFAAGSGGDWINGRGGDDTITGGIGADTLHGGDGNDLVFGGAGADRLFGGDGDDTLLGGAGDDTLVAGTGDNELLGGGGDDLLVGGDGSDTLVGGGGNDTLEVGGWGAGAQSLFDGGAGNDLLSFAGLSGDFAVDLASGSMSGGGGNATLLSIENVIGGGGDDTIRGSGANMIDGGEGNDSLVGREGADTLYGGAGDDTLGGGLGRDLLYGGDGNDELRGGRAEDTLFGGGGSDTLFGGLGADELYGGAGHDALYGGQGADTVFGGAGNDLIFGDEGPDILYGGNGADTLFGGNGADTLFGGAGADHFVWAVVNHIGTGANSDRIMDFETGLDRIDLSGIGGLTFIGAGAFTGVAGQLRYAIEGGEGRLSGDTTGNGVASFVITLDNAANLTAADLIL